MTAPEKLLGKKLKNKDIKKMFRDKEFLRKYGRLNKHTGEWSIIFTTFGKHEGLKYVTVGDIQIFNDKGEVLAFCNGYAYYIKSELLKWEDVPYEQAKKHWLVLQGFASACNMSAFKD
jgi:hypothetical protein